MNKKDIKEVMSYIGKMSHLKNPRDTQFYKDMANKRWEANSFNEWLFLQIKKQTPIGDLSRDSFDNCSIKDLPKTKIGWKKYLDKHNADSVVYDILKEAQLEYELFKLRK